MNNQSFLKSYKGISMMKCYFKAFLQPFLTLYLLFFKCNGFRHKLLIGIQFSTIQDKCNIKIPSSIFCYLLFPFCVLPILILYKEAVAKLASNFSSATASSLLIVNHLILQLMTNFLLKYNRGLSACDHKGRYIPGKQYLLH